MRVAGLAAGSGMVGWFVDAVAGVVEENIFEGGLSDADAVDSARPGVGDGGDDAGPVGMFKVDFVVDHAGGGVLGERAEALVDELGEVGWVGVVDRSDGQDILADR